MGQKNRKKATKAAKMSADPERNEKLKQIKQIEKEFKKEIESIYSQGKSGTENSLIYLVCAGLGSRLSAPENLRA